MYSNGGHSTIPNTIMRSVGAKVATNSRPQVQRVGFGAINDELSRPSTSAGPSNGLAGSQKSHPNGMIIDSGEPTNSSRPPNSNQRSANANGSGGIKSARHNARIADGAPTGPIKLVVLGSGGVGKSAITIQFVQQYFICDYDPTIADSYSKQCFVDGTPQKLEVLDTAGQDEFSTMREQFLRTGDGFLLVFSLTSRESLDYVCQLQRHIDRLKDRDQFPMILVGNKCDLEEERQVKRAEAQQIADALRISYVECSAKFRLNIDQTFYDLVRLVRQFQINERLEDAQFPHDDETDKALRQKKKRKRNCRIQ